MIMRRGVTGRPGRSATESDEPKRLVIRQFLPEFVDLSVTAGEIRCCAPGWGCLAVRAGGYAIRVCLMSDSFATSVQYEAQRNLSPVSSHSNAVGGCWVLFDQWL